MSAVGIKRLHAYVPPWRLTPDHFRTAWSRGVKTTRSVAGHDEDAVTMAADAALECVDAVDRSKIGGLYFASTRSGLGERGVTPLLGAAIDLGESVFSGEFVGSLRGATQAIRAGVDAVRAGSAEEVLVAAGDIRLMEPGTAGEESLGDAGAAVVLGTEDLLAEIVATHSYLEEFLYVWRREGEPYLIQGDTKFVGDHGRARILGEAIDGVLADAAVSKSDVAQVATYAPDPRALGALQKALGFAPEQMAGADVLASIGNTGSVSPLLALCDAFTRAKPGDLVVLAGYGGGADALVLRVCDGIETRRAEFDLSNHIQGGLPLASYEKYLQFRRILPDDRVDAFTSLPVLWREQRELIRLYALVCDACGAVQFPPRRICWKCSEKDRFSEKRLSRRGTVYTFTRDHLVPGPEKPTAMISADLDGGGRFYTQFTDAPTETVTIGMPVEPVFRRFHEGEGAVHYFWKLRPAPDGAGS